MRVARLGLTPVKGMKHTAHSQLKLTADGPLHDRMFCVVDAASNQVLRTVEDDTSMACQAVWKPPVLMIRTPVGDVTGEVADGESLTGRYWDRDLRLAAVDGPWTGVLSRYLGRRVLLCRVVGRRRAVWSGPVSLVTTSSLAELARRLGRGYDDGARFRATVVVDTADAPPFVEDTWVGASLRIGAAVVTIEDRLPRCAVVDRRPGAGGHDASVLAALARDRHVGSDIVFGISGRVWAPGWVAVGDTVRRSWDVG